DLSNALGFGMNYGEAIKALQDIPEKDWRGFWRHVRLTFSSGGGLLPSGLGPSVSGAAKVLRAMGQGRGWDQFKKEITPVQLKRFAQGFKALKNRKGKMYPMYSGRGHLMYYVTKKELVMRTIGPRLARESKEYKDWRAASLLEQERREVLRDITVAIVENDNDTANKLINKYSIVPTPKQIENEILKRELSREERDSMKEPGVVDLWQIQREGELY
ncbi:MAG: hypothetical protein JRH15_22975, partial [Deltaproteobacteria bacterium]|nr:hypothetical protein [Deltaproteobacteria bacterium]